MAVVKVSGKVSKVFGASSQGLALTETFKAANDDLEPIDDAGELVLPGVRICGHKDCVNPKHVAS